MKTYVRKFQTINELGRYEQIADEVIKGIEIDTINVFRPDDEDALVRVRDSDGASLLGDRAKMTVSIREWLPVVCQFIRWEYECDMAEHEGGDHDTLAYYSSNACDVLWPKNMAGLPPGPGALVAGITLRWEQCVGSEQNTARELDRLMFIVAHELVHAIHAMKFVVPAFLDWQTFCKVVLHEGAGSDLLILNHGYRNDFLDNYGTEMELKEVLQFWPSQGKRWFEACRSVSKPRARKHRSAKGKK